MKTVNINNIVEVQTLLQPLEEDAKAVWGNMTAQQMVEHMIDQVQYTNGVKIPVDTGLPPDFAEQRQRWVYTDELIPRNVVLGTLPDEYAYSDLESAKQRLINELETFHHYHRANTGATMLHGGFGQMNYHEWTLWHNKHLNHHFNQFGLL